MLHFTLLCHFCILTYDHTIQWGKSYLKVKTKKPGSHSVIQDGIYKWRFFCMKHRVWKQGYVALRTWAANAPVLTSHSHTPPRCIHLLRSECWHTSSLFGRNLQQRLKSPCLLSHRQRLVPMCNVSATL